MPRLSKVGLPWLLVLLSLSPPGGSFRCSTREKEIGGVRGLVPKFLEPDSIHPRKAEQEGFEDLSRELAPGGPLLFSLPQGYFRPVRSRAASRRGCRKAWSRGEGGSMGPVPVLVGQAGLLFPEARLNLGKIQGSVRGLMGLQL